MITKLGESKEIQCMYVASALHGVFLSAKDDFKKNEIRCSEGFFRGQTKEWKMATTSIATRQ